VPHRPLALVSMLAVGDYLLWNWSLNGNHDVLALVSGLTLPPLAIACVWLLALSLARLIAHSTNRSRPPARGGEMRGSQRARDASAVRSEAGEASIAVTGQAPPPSPGKLAA
jgi:hypothetical protein